MGESSKACKFPGSTSSSFPGSDWGCTTATVGTETASVSFASALDSVFRFRNVTAPAVIRTSSTAPIRIFPRPAGAGPRSEGRYSSGRTDSVSFCSVVTGGGCTGIIAVSKKFSASVLLYFYCGLLLFRLQLCLAAGGNNRKHTGHEE